MSKCVHDKRKSRCKVCSPHLCCIHNRFRCLCKECKENPFKEFESKDQDSALQATEGGKEVKGDTGIFDDIDTFDDKRNLEEFMKIIEHMDW